MGTAVAATLLAPCAASRVSGGKVGQCPEVWMNAGGELAADIGACCVLWQEYKAVFYECSAMTGYNIMEPMLHMARLVMGTVILGYFPSCRSLVSTSREWARRSAVRG